MKFLIPLIAVLFGAGAGAGGALMLREPKDEVTVTPQEEPEPEEVESPLALVTLDNQFVVPIVEDGDVTSMVVLSLGLEVKPGSENTVYAREAKIRDLFLRTLFQHPHIGGFWRDFTSLRNLEMLRSSLLTVATEEIGPDVQGILIISLARQDV